jgi:hypothetical protein
MRLGLRRHKPQSKPAMVRYADLWRPRQDAAIPQPNAALKSAQSCADGDIARSARVLVISNGRPPSECLVRQSQKE